MRAVAERTRIPARLLLCPLAVGAVMAAAGYLPTRSLTGAAGVRAMMAAHALVLAVVYLTLVPTLRKMVHAEAARRLRLALTAGAGRLAGTIVLVAIVLGYHRFEPVAFLVWVGIGYVIIVQAQTLTLVWWHNRLEGQA